MRMFSAWAPSPAPLVGMAGQQLQQQQPLVIPIPAIQSQSARLGSCCSNQPVLLPPEWPVGHWIVIYTCSFRAAWHVQAKQPSPEPLPEAGACHVAQPGWLEEIHKHMNAQTASPHHPPFYLSIPSKNLQFLVH